MINRSTLNGRQAEQGARFAGYHGWQIADDFGDPLSEYRAVRESAGVLDLSYLGELRVSGRDRVRFLHNLLSNDIKKLTPGTGCYATLLTHQGRMESDMYVYAFEHEFLLECPPAGHDRLYQALNKCIVSEQVAVEDTSSTFCKLSVQGPHAGQVVGSVTGIAVEDLALLDHRAGATSGEGTIVIRRDRTGCDGYDLRMPAANVLASWERLVGDCRLRPVGHRALNWLRTEAGIPWFGVDMDHRNLPMEMGLSSAISLNKGCYRGQEIVARITYRGHLDRKLGAVSIRHTEPPESGCRIFADGVKIGEVTSSIFSPRLNRPLALAVLKTDFLAAGTAVEVAYGDTTIAGEVVTLPLS